MQGAGWNPPSVSAAVGESFQRLIRALTNVLPAVLGVIAVLVVFWALATFARNTARTLTGFMRDHTRRLLIIQVTYCFVWVIGAVVALDSIGMNLQTFATAFGLGGVAVGFALKDILSNLVSGVLILAMRPFKIGDQIVVGDTEGTVEQIEFRATQIRTYDGRLVLVPNGEVFTSRITNNTASPLRRASVLVYLDYREDTGRALAVMLETVKAVPGVAAFPVPWIGVRDFQLDAVQLEARFWAQSDRAQLTGTTSEARIAVVRALKAAGIRFPDRDERTVRIAPSEPPSTFNAADPPRR